MGALALLGSLLNQGNGTTTTAPVLRNSTATANTTGTGSSTNSTSSSSVGANITSNDFMTLLVAEMKNQDPTQPTDPNAYIQQMVGVNSLEQLISINGELGSIGTTGTPTSTGNAQRTSTSAV